MTNNKCPKCQNQHIEEGWGAGTMFCTNCLHEWKVKTVKTDAPRHPWIVKGSDEAEAARQAEMREARKVAARSEREALIAEGKRRDVLTDEEREAEDKKARESYIGAADIWFR